MERYRVDAVIYDPEVATDPPKIIAEATTYGDTLEGAIASMAINLAPHIAHMGYEFAIQACGIWCHMHDCWHPIRELLEGHVVAPPVPPETQEASN